jgi:hypothetical protein
MHTEPAAVVRSYWDRVFLERDLDALASLVTDPSVRHTADGTRTFSIAELRTHLDGALRSLRAESVEIDAMSVDGSTVWLRTTLRGVSMASMSPLRIAWLAQYRIEDGRIAESWSLHQVGADW